MIRRKGLQTQKLMPTLSFSATCEFWKVIEPSFLCTVHVYYPGFIVPILCLSSQLLPVTLADCTKLQSELKKNSIEGGVFILLFFHEIYP